MTPWKSIFTMKLCSTWNLRMVKHISSLKRKLIKIQARDGNGEKFMVTIFHALWWKFINKSTWLMTVRMNVNSTSDHGELNAASLSSGFIRNFTSVSRIVYRIACVGAATCVRFCYKQKTDDRPRLLSYHTFHRVKSIWISCWKFFLFLNRKISIALKSKVCFKHPVLLSNVKKLSIRCFRCLSSERANLDAMFVTNNNSRPTPRSAAKQHDLPSQ